MNEPTNKSPKFNPLNSSVKFFKEDLWHLDFSSLDRLRKSIYKSLQILYVVGEGFIKDKLLLRASSLTFWSLLSIVPLFAFMFSILKGLGVQRRLEPIILERVAIGSQEIISQIINYIDRVNVGSLGAIGLVVLILTVVSMLSNIETSFNDIWGIKKHRSTIRKFSDYLSMLFLLPLLFLAALSVTATMKSTTFVTWLTAQPGLGPLVILLIKMLPFFTMWLLFTFLYMFMPNTKVRLKPALLAAIVTGTFWQIAQWGYVTFQVGVTRYNAIYGTFAQLPIMLIWIYISWVIVLFGAEFSFAMQNVTTYRKEQESDTVNIDSRLELAIAFLVDIYKAFKTGQQPWQDSLLAEKHFVSIRLARRVLDMLVQAGMIIDVHEEMQHRLVPSRELGEVAISSIIEKLEQVGPNLEQAAMLLYQKEQPVQQLRMYEKAVLQKAKIARKHELDSITLEDCLDHDRIQ